MEEHSQTVIYDRIDEEYYTVGIAAELLDELLSKGWRLLGYCLIRHNTSSWGDVPCTTEPLRVRLADFTLSKRQRKLLRRNADLEVRIGPVHITPEKFALFRAHTFRFSERVPDSLYSFLNIDPDWPVTGTEMSVYEAGKLVACSYVHNGVHSVSATYCFFDPSLAHRSLGQYTMLLELLEAQRTGKTYYYHGYAYSIPSQFDYKRNFSALEQMDWPTETWWPCERQGSKEKD